MKASYNYHTQAPWLQAIGFPPLSNSNHITAQATGTQGTVVPQSYRSISILDLAAA